MAIPIITEEVNMPEMSERRFTYSCNNGNINSTWYVYDNLNHKKISTGKFEDMQFKCYYLNKAYYKSLEKKAT